MLIFAWGNPSRGDDALGPALIERIGAALPAHPEWGEVALLTDFQLQPEHALDLAGHGRVLFVDASVSCATPYVCAPLRPRAGFGYTTHAMQPEALLAVFRQVTGREPPPAWLLTIRGYVFELGEPISAGAQAHLEAAAAFVASLLSGDWQRPD
ncbi:MAG: hydrogenase maturation protease [Betaproteobacteria bacterium]|nr:hydrogenase maturation protease [Betaproteobacteria bacterium]